MKQWKFLGNYIKDGMLYFSQTFQVNKKVANTTIPTCIQVLNNNFTNLSHLVLQQPLENRQ